MGYQEQLLTVSGLELTFNPNYLDWEVKTKDNYVLFTNPDKEKAIKKVKLITLQDCE